MFPRLPAAVHRQHAYSDLCVFSFLRRLGIYCNRVVFFIAFKGIRPFVPSTWILCITRVSRVAVSHQAQVIINLDLPYTMSSKTHEDTPFDTFNSAESRMREVSDKRRTSDSGGGSDTSGLSKILNVGNPHRSRSRENGPAVENSFQHSSNSQQYGGSKARAVILGTHLQKFLAVAYKGGSVPTATKNELLEILALFHPGLRLTIETSHEKLLALFDLLVRPYFELLEEFDEENEVMYFWDTGAL